MKKTVSKNINKNQLLDLGIIIIYIVSSIVLSLFHEPWRDESQAWVLAQNSSFFQIFQLCASEGHPLLWFYLIKIIIMFGCSFEFFSLISIFFTSLAVVLMLKFSKLCKLLQIIFIFSPLFFYYNPVICRIYSVLILLVCLLCALWNNRNDKPILYGILVALMFQTHVLLFGLAIGCIFDMLIELIKNNKKMIKKRVIALLIPCMSFLMAIIELKQPDGTETFIDITFDSIMNNFSAKRMWDGINSIAIKLQLPNANIVGKMLLSTIGFFIILCCLLLLKDTFRRDNLNQCIVFLTSVIVYCGIIIFVRNSAHIQMSIVLLMLLMYFSWTVHFDTMKNNIFVVVLLIILLACMPRLIYDTIKDIEYPFSGSKEIANIIESEVESDSIIVVSNNPYSTSVVAYLANSDFLIWDITYGEEYVIHKWGKTPTREIDNNNIYDYINEDLRQFVEGKKIYYVQTSKKIITDMNIPNMISIGGNEQSNNWNEYYWLYEVEYVK